MTKRSLDLAEVKSRLDSLALELLKGRFLNVDVEPYFRVAEGIVEERMRRDEAYRRRMEGDNPLETLITFSMGKVQEAYVLISGQLGEEKVDKLLKDYETMVSDYLQSVGLLIDF